MCLKKRSRASVLKDEERVSSTKLDIFRVCETPESPLRLEVRLSVCLCCPLVSIRGKAACAVCQQLRGKKLVTFLN